MPNCLWAQSSLRSIIPHRSTSEIWAKSSLGPNNSTVNIPCQSTAEVWAKLSLGPKMPMFNYPMPKYLWSLSPIVSGPKHPYVQLSPGKLPLKSEPNFLWAQTSLRSIIPCQTTSEVWDQPSLGPKIPMFNYPLPKYLWNLSPIVSGPKHSYVQL